MTKQTITVTAVVSDQGSTVQNYMYDSLDRLSSAYEKPLNRSQTNCGSDPAKYWKQTIVYDANGNRAFNTALNRTTALIRTN